jgi:ATP-binding cassette subfamily B (MDR/TAP) protein 1
MAWFDLTNQAELSSKFAGDTLAFQQSIGEKVSMTIYIISLCLSGIIIAFIKGWLMTLVVFVIIPIFALTSYFYIYTSQRRAIHEKK